MGCVVLDPFLGSGSTLMACEQTGRICRTIELDEKYADVIVHRYMEFVGSAEDVYVLVKEVAPDIGLATIYRTLDLFTELDLLKRLDFGDGRNRYELNDEEFAHFHHHLICVKCGKVSEFEDDMLETLESIIAKKLNFRTIDHQLKVYGYCSDCQNHMTEAELEKLERMSHHG